MIRTSSRSSSLLNNSRGQAGGTTSLSASVKPDAIFDAYLPLVKARYVDTLEAPEREGQHSAARNRLIDLGATESDHNPTGNEKDWTMRAGAERGVLPLVRRFNEHSERVLSSSLGDSDTRAAHSAEAQSAEQIPPGQSRRKKARTEGERGVELEDYHTQHASRYEEEIVIDDLEERRERIAMPLELRAGGESRARRRNAGDVSQRQEARMASRPTRSAIIEEMSSSLADLKANGVIALEVSTRSSSSGTRKESSSGMSVVEQELRTLLEARKTRSWTDLNDLPDHIKKRALDIQGSATEVLRQFWNAVSASDQDKDTRLKVEEGEAPLPPLTPAEREAKAKRMMKILSRILPQAEELLHQTGGGLDEEKVASALSTTLEACQRAQTVGEMVYCGGDGGGGTE